MDYGFILGIDGIPIREVPLRYKAYTKKIVCDGNLNRIKIYKTKKNADAAIEYYLSRYKQYIDDVYRYMKFEVDATDIKIYKCRISLEEL